MIIKRTTINKKNTKYWKFNLDYSKLETKITIFGTNDDSFGLKNIGDHRISYVGKTKDDVLTNGEKLVFEEYRKELNILLDALKIQYNDDKFFAKQNFENNLKTLEKEGIILDDCHGDHVTTIEEIEEMYQEHLSNIEETYCDMKKYYFQQLQSLNIN